MNSKQKPSLSYRDAGVDIDRGTALVDRIKPIARRTSRPEVMGSLGGFGALFDLSASGYRQPVLVAGTDGVGTKLKLAIAAGNHRHIGIDLVAMCANDLIVQGAEPLFFLDYYASGKLDLDVAETVIDGIGRGCELAGAALVGGETAEMPGMYAGEDYDLSGFCVGVVERDRIIDGSRVAVGDALIGIGSSGPHSNGYSLVRKVLDVAGARLDDAFGDSTLGDTLLEPTRIYVKPVLTLLQTVTVHALAHITGGGLPDNLPRVMPPATRAVIQSGSWTRPAIFDWLQTEGNIETAEMYRTFNCGIGMVVVVPAEQAQQAIDILNDSGESACRIGVIETGSSSQPGAEPEVIIQ